MTLTGLSLSYGRLHRERRRFFVSEFSPVATVTQQLWKLSGSIARPPVRMFRWTCNRVLYLVGDVCDLYLTLRYGMRRRTP